MSDPTTKKSAKKPAARTWADADPYVAAGVYTRVEVRPFRRLLP